MVVDPLHRFFGWVSVFPFNSMYDILVARERRRRLPYGNIA